MKKEESKILEAVRSGQRLDKYMAGHLKFSRSKIKKNIKKGQVLVNKEEKRPHYTLKKGDRIEYLIKSADKGHIIPQNISLKIFKETSEYVIINKPSDFVVHPAPGNPDGTLLNALAYRYKTPRLVHRLDQDTSGVMIAALNDKSALNIKKQFKKKKVKKIYLALVKGILENEAGQIDIPIKRDSRDRTKMRAGWTSGRKSTTRYRVRERFHNATYVEVYPLTGRTHQLRVHFSHLGHPILGDRKYGEPPYKAPRQMLHAWQVSFYDLATKKRVSYTIEPPEDFLKSLSGLDKIKV